MGAVGFESLMLMWILYVLLVVYLKSLVLEGEEVLEEERVVIRKRREEGRSLYLVFDRNLLRQREKAERGT
jgi:hypothetical protein